MADLDRYQNAEAVFLTDTDTGDIAQVLDTTPSGSEVGLLVRECRQGQAAAADSFPVVLASDQPYTFSAFGYNQVVSDTTAVQLGAAAAKAGVAIKAHNANTLAVYLGDASVTTSTGWQLGPGESIVLPLTNANLLYIIAADDTQTISWIAL